MTSPRAALPGRKKTIWRWLRWCAAGVASAWALAALSLVSFRFIDPPTTALQVERRIQSWVSGKPYSKRYTFAAMGRISPNLQHAVVAAEDTRFYQHHGFDWVEIQNAIDDRMDDGRQRGASTITQQLVKNLFFGTGGSLLRKAAEATLVPVAEFGVGKRRILELYLNVVEWGPGIYGAEAAARYHYKIPAQSVGRDQAARLAAILPLPLKRKPARMNQYSEAIEARMSQMGW